MNWLFHCQFGIFLWGKKLTKLFLTNLKHFLSDCQSMGSARQVKARNAKPWPRFDTSGQKQKRYNSRWFDHSTFDNTTFDITTFDITTFNNPTFNFTTFNNPKFDYPTVWSCDVRASYWIIRRLNHPTVGSTLSCRLFRDWDYWINWII